MCHVPAPVARTKLTGSSYFAVIMGAGGQIIVTIASGRPLEWSTLQLVVPRVSLLSSPPVRSPNHTHDGERRAACGVPELTPQDRYAPFIANGKIFSEERSGDLGSFAMTLWVTTDVRTRRSPRPCDETNLPWAIIISLFI